MTNYKKLSIIIPVFNEERTLERLLKKVFDLQFESIDTEVIVVDDNSTDNSRQILENTKREFLLLTNNKNLGKSLTVKKGILKSTGDLVVIQDADLEYDPNDLYRFINLFQLSDVDVVYGNRFGQRNKIVYPLNWVGNTLLSIFSAMFTGPRARIWPRDMEVCYKMIRGDIYREIAKQLKSTSNFGFEPEITARIARYKTKAGKHLKFAQIPVYFDPRTKTEGKKLNAISDGIKAFIEIIRYNLLKI